jgi:hypothetical protein
MNSRYRPVVEVRNCGAEKAPVFCVPDDLLGLPLTFALFQALVRIREAVASSYPYFNLLGAERSGIWAGGVSTNFHPRS